MNAHTLIKKKHESDLDFTATPEVIDGEETMRFSLVRTTAAGVIERFCNISFEDQNGFPVPMVRSEVFKHLAHQITAAESEMLLEADAFAA